VFLRETPDSRSWRQIHERSRIVDFSEGFAQDGLDQGDQAESHISVGRDPVFQIGDDLRLEDSLVRLTWQGRPRRAALHGHNPHHALPRPGRSFKESDSVAG
jgi:hypothetical protein